MRGPLPVPIVLRIALDTLAAKGFSPINEDDLKEGV